MLQKHLQEYEIKKNRTFHTDSYEMKNLGVLLFVLLLSSCNYFDKKKVDADEILNESLQSFNWNQVDEYPLFEGCDSTVSKEEVRACFEEVLSGGIYEGLSESRFIVTETLNDTLFLDFEISHSGDIVFIRSNGSSLIYDQIPDIDSLVISSLSGLPKVQPAIKRGQQVRTAFKIPIILQTD